MAAPATARQHDSTTAQKAEQLLPSGWTMNAWSRLARQKEERTSSALTRRFELRTTTPTASYCGNPSAPCLKAPEIIPSHAQAAARPPTHNSGGRAARLYSLCSVDFSPTLLLPRRPIRRSYALHRPASFAPRCAATSLLLRSCTVVLTIKRWDAPRPVSLTRGFKGHTPFIRPVFETASAASCLCHQVRLGLLLHQKRSESR